MRYAMVDTLRTFSNMTNAEAYVEVFHNRLMRPLPNSLQTGEYWGSTTRADFYPPLRKILSELTASGEARVLDVGAGSGEMIDHVLRNYRVAISAVEPNKIMLESYLEALKRTQGVRLHSAYAGTVQSLYGGKNALWLENLPPQHLVLASHMIYGLTSAGSEEVNPEDDLVSFLSALYNKVEIDGCVFIVYSVGEDTLLGEAAADFLGRWTPQSERNVRRIWQARTNLLENAGAKSQLDALYPDFECEFTVQKVCSRIYGETVDDLAAYCILGELTEIDNRPFNIDKLRSNFEFIANHSNQFNMGEVIGGSRDGMFTATVPQVICTLKKREV